jgi:nucleolar MIF4G domain-containing protein 1
MEALLALYSSNPRAVVSTTLTSLLLGIISDRDNLGDALVVTYAALVASLFRTIGIELPAGMLARSIELLDIALKKFADAGDAPVPGEGEDAFEGRPGSKECLNLVAFLAELYNFQVIHCGVIYDLVRLCIDSGLSELHVELLSKIVKRAFLPSLSSSILLILFPLAGCGQSLRQDDPSALKEIITLVKQKMQGVDPASMKCVLLFFAIRSSLH